MAELAGAPVEHASPKPNERDDQAGENPPALEGLAAGEDQLEADRHRFLRTVDIQDRTYRFTTYKQCFVGSEAVAAMVKSGWCKTKEEALALGEKLRSKGFFAHVTNEHAFKDGFLFYRMLDKHEKLLWVGENFWNLRAPLLMAGGLADIGCHSSLIRLQSGKFLVLDTVPLTDVAKYEIDRLTDNGRLIEAVLGVHSFHTLFFEPFRAHYPDAPFFGCPRHLTRLAHLNWAGSLLDPAIRSKWEPEVFMSIPDGAEFVDPKPPASNHFSSVVVFHALSKVVHADDTFMVWRNVGLVLKLALGKTYPVDLHLSAYRGALEDPIAFATWLRGILNQWDFDSIVSAHNGNMIGGAKQALADCLEREEPKLLRLAAKLQKTAPASLKEPDVCAQGDECG